MARTSFAAVTTTPSKARSFVRQTLQTWGQHHLVQDAEVITSELVTNAVKATRNTARHSDDLRDIAAVGIELLMDEGAFRISVQDGSTEQPALQMAGDDAENGRGLILVEALSIRWDVFFVAGGKVTWAELALARQDGAPAPCRDRDRTS